MKVLIIDDERSIRNTLKEILEFEGHEVVTAEDGKQGVDKALADSFDAIFCDIKMPVMDGNEVLDTLVQAGCESSIIMISGHGDDLTLSEGSAEIVQDLFLPVGEGQVAHLHPLAEQPQKRYRHVERVEAGKPSLAVILLHIQVVDSHMASEQVQPHMLHVRLPANQVVGVVVDIIFGGASAKEAARNHHQQHPR